MSLLISPFYHNPLLLVEEVVVRKEEALYMLFNKGRVVRGIEGESGAILNLVNRACCRSPE